MSDIEIRPLRLTEIDQFTALSYYAFSGRTPDERAGDFGRRADPQRQALVLVEGGEITSQLLINDFGTWYDGVRFPAGGLSNVATVPEKARHGYADKLLRAALAWMRDELGMTLSTLYATVYPLYNGLGWALAEDGLRYSGPPTAFRPASHLPIDPGGRVVRRQARLDDVALLEPVYRVFAQPRSGYLDRPRWYWEDTVLRYESATRPRWLALWYGSDQRLAGYALYTLGGTPLSPRPESELRVYEVVSLRPEGYHALLTFLSAHHLWKQIQIDGGRDVPWRSLVANPHQLEAQADFGHRFLLRVVDVQRAIRQKAVLTQGPVPDAAVRVVDEAAPWNDGTWLIGQRGAAWTCEPSANREADATVDVATLAQLFTGFLPVRQAIDVGMLRAKDEARATLEALFATAHPPHSVDHF